jgi:hypothetical protein
MNYKIITQTIIWLTFIFLIGLVTRSENKRKSLEREIITLENDLKEKQDSLKYYYHIHLKEIELNNIVDKFYYTRKLKAENKVLQQFKY